jgi:hypothetical protein
MNWQAAEVISSIICRRRSSAGADKVEAIS